MKWILFMQMSRESKICLSMCHWLLYNSIGNLLSLFIVVFCANVWLHMIFQSIKVAISFGIVQCLAKKKFLKTNPHQTVWVMQQQQQRQPLDIRYYTKHMPTHFVSLGSVLTRNKIKNSRYILMQNQNIDDDYIYRLSLTSQPQPNIRANGAAQLNCVYFIVLPSRH